MTDFAALPISLTLGPSPDGEGRPASPSPLGRRPHVAYAVNRAHEPGYIMEALILLRKVDVQPSGARKLPVEKIGSNSRHVDRLVSEVASRWVGLFSQSRIGRMS